jgi:hypothetical protein
LDAGNIEQNLIGHASDYQFVAMASGGSGEATNQCNVVRENLTLDIGSIVQPKGVKKIQAVMVLGYVNVTNVLLALTLLFSFRTMKWSFAAEIQ